MSTAAAGFTRSEPIPPHLKSGSRMPGIETNDFESKMAEFMHQPWRHRSSLDPYADVFSRMPTHQTADLLWGTDPAIVSGRHRRGCK
jgi:hypothetical protein